MLETFAKRIAPAEAEDLVQQTIESFLEAHVDRALPEKVDHWLMKTLMNRFLDQCRKKGVRDRAQTDPAFADKAGPCSPDPNEPPNPYAVVSPEQLEAAVGRLSPKLQETFQFHMAGMKNDEIADKLSITPGAVAKRLHDARVKLRALLAASLEGGES